jgi:site-specific recombinase XerC
MQTPRLEVASLRIKHIDRVRGFLYVVNGNGGKHRTAIVTRLVMEALQTHIQGGAEGYVFESRAQGHISARQIQRLLDEAAEKVALQETRPGRIRDR